MLPPTKIVSLGQLLDRTALFDLVRHERLYRDTQQWSAMADCYGEGSVVVISWFNGSGLDFAEASRRQYESGKGSGLHFIQPLRLWLNGDRAVVESHGEILIRAVKDGSELEIVSFCRFVSRAMRQNGEWKLMSLVSIFIRDTLHAILHDETLSADWDALRAARRSVRFLTWLTNSQYDEAVEMIAEDEPEKVAAMYEADQRWLMEAA